MSDGPRIFVSTGELSGDYHASNLVKAIRQLSPDAEFFGIGSHNLKSAGVELIADSSDWGGIGVYANMLKSPVTIRTGKAVIKKIPHMNLNLIIVVDFRVFHASLLKGIRHLDIGKLYYFAPVLWPGFEPHSIGKKYSDFLRFIRNRDIRDRFETMSELADKLIVAYPFALENYKQVGADVEFLGHPLMNAVKADIPPEQVRAKLGIDNNTRLVGIFPGSRSHELKSHLPVLREVIAKLKSEFKNIKFYIPIAHPDHKAIISTLLKDQCNHILYIEGDNYNIFAASDLAISKTGTSVQVLMALGVPTVAFYTVVSSIWYNISIRYIVRFDHIAFPNVIAGKRIIPEFIQDDFNARNLVKASLEILGDNELSRKMSRDLLEIRAMLYREDALERAAQIALDLAHKHMDN